MSDAGRVEALWTKRARRGRMDAVDTATFVAGKGMVGNADQGGRRQVTVLSRERWDACMAELDASIDPATRRANVLVSGVDLAETRGRVLQLGPVRLRIFGETRPCERMDEALPGLRDRMRPNWGGGAYGEVIEGGVVRVGDAVRWAEVPAEAGAPSH